MLQSSLRPSPPSSSADPVRAAAESGIELAAAADSGTPVQRLERHLAAMRAANPEAELLLLFDVDRTLLDLSFGLAELLQKFDARRGSRHFADLDRAALVPTEAGLRQLLEACEVPRELRDELLNEYLRLCWSPCNRTSGSQPFLGQLELLRWLRMQPATHLAFVTARGEDRRMETLQALDALGRGHGQRFAAPRLFSAGAGLGRADPAALRRAALAHFRAAGFKVIACVGAAASTALDETALDETALDEKGPEEASPEAQRGSRAEATDLLQLSGAELAAELPQVRGEGAPLAVWRALRNASDLEQFVGSAVEMGELWITRCPNGALRWGSREGAESRPELAELLAACAQADKRLRIVLPEGRDVLPRLALELERCCFPTASLEFAACPSVLEQTDLAGLAERFPGARFIARIGPWSGFQAFAPDLAAAGAQRVAAAGFHAVSTGFEPRGVGALKVELERCGLQLDLVADGGLAEYVEAVARLPYSVTSHFRSDPALLAGNGAAAQPS